MFRYANHFIDNTCFFFVKDFTMELRDVLLTIIKILISVPAILLYQSCITEATGLMGGHFDNSNSSLSNSNNDKQSENVSVSTCFT